MTDVFIVDALRTPFGAFGGDLSDLSAPKLAAQVIGKLLANAKLPPQAVEEVILGQVLSGGSGQAPARQAMRLAGIPDSAHAMTINKVCGSGLKSIMLAADAICLGNAEVVIAGGMENMSMAPYALPKARFGQRMGHGELLDLLVYDGLQDPYCGQHMGEITERWIARHQLTRTEQDAFAERSYRLAKAAVEKGVFASEIVPVVKQSRKGDVIIDRDEEPFKGDPDKLPGLRPAFRKDGSITAGNASSINDGAAVALVSGPAAVKKYNLQPVARIVASATNSIDPDLFAEAPVDAIRRVAEKASLKLEQIGLFEINEAFAAVPLVAIRQLGLDPDKVNVHGGAVALGHPIGASGGRLVATLVREMKQRGERYGLATLCIGGGEAVAMVLELV